MTEFRVASNTESNRSRDRRIRLITWGTVLTLSGITLFAVYGVHSANYQLNTALAWLAVLIVVGAIVGAYFLATRLGLDRLERDLAFVLTDKNLVCRRKGWPDVSIDFSEIKTLHEQHGWLVIESVEPHKRIAVPKEVAGFASLRTELTKYSPVIVPPPRRSVMGFISMLASLLCWGLVLLSRRSGVVKVAGAVALILLGWESFRLFKQLRHNPKRLLLWALISLSWVAAILVVYFRIARII